MLSYSKYLYVTLQLYFHAFLCFLILVFHFSGALKHALSERLTNHNAAVYFDWLNAWRTDAPVLLKNLFTWPRLHRPAGESDAINSVRFLTYLHGLGFSSTYLDSHFLYIPT